MQRCDSVNYLKNMKKFQLSIYNISAFVIFISNIKILPLLIIFISLVPIYSYAADDDNTFFLKTLSEIKDAATSHTNGNALPLAATWNAGRLPNTYSPSFQIDLIKKGHHILPSFWLDAPYGKPLIRVKNYYKDFYKLAEYKLPITFISTQWESILSEHPDFLKLPNEANPNTVTTSNTVEKKLSPFSPNINWYIAGNKWSSTSQLAALQSVYPDPPLILFISNNEHEKLRWHEAKHDIRFTQQYNTAIKEEIIDIFAESWIQKYRTFQNGMREGLKNLAWKNNSKFIGYDAFGPSSIGRWREWDKYSLHTNKFISPWPLAWDGSSTSFYTHNWDPSTDYNVWGPMISSMNYIFMKKEAHELNPDFWFEVILWDGYDPRKNNNKRNFYASQGQQYNPDRYQGMVKYAMWLLRPRVVREFRHAFITLDDTKDYFMKVVESVDEIYNNEKLKQYWKHGILVANTQHKHPYQSNFIPRYNNENRWFLLDTDLDPKRPWNLHTIIPVFAIAISMHGKPNREWLLYCFTPINEKRYVNIIIPGYKSVNAECKNNGSYHQINENNNTIFKIN